MSTDSITEFHRYRTEWNDRILSAGNKNIQRFFALDTAAYREGAIPVKMKELMGLVGSMVLRCNDCILYHIDRCVSEGASRGELIEAMNIALVIGGSIVIPHMRYGFEMMDRLLGEEERAAEEPPGDPASDTGAIRSIGAEPPTDR